MSIPSPIKIAIVILAIFVAPFSIHATTYFDITPTTVNSQDTNISLTAADWSALEVIVFPPTGSDECGNGGMYCGLYTTDINVTFFQLVGQNIDPETQGVWHLLALDPADPNSDEGGLCTGDTGSYTQCLTSGGYLGQDSTITFSSSPTITGMAALIAGSDTGFETTVGFPIANVVTWSEGNLTKLFIGSGMAVLFYLRFWIVGLVIIGAIIYFSFMAFRFFRH